MSSAERIMIRLAEVEAERHHLRSQLSSIQRNKSPDRPRKQTTNLRKSSSQANSLAAPLGKATRWLNTPAQRKLQSPLLDFFTQYERHHIIFDKIYRCLDIKDILAITQTCKRLSSFYKSMLPCRWNINRRLARFVDDPKEFRSQLGQADALISGTFALLFFAQLYWLDSGMDIYVTQGKKADTLVRYIGGDSNYEFDHSYGWTDHDERRTLTKILAFRRKGPPASPQIRFHLTSTLPLHSILTECAFSTAHVNIITWNKAYCMFPYLTLIDRRMYLLHDPDEALGEVLSKYSAHSWRTSDWIDYDQPKGCDKPGIRESSRRIGDASTWTLPLSLHKIRAPTTPDSVLESCTFQIFPDSGPPQSQHLLGGLKTFSIGARPFSCCMLKYAYTFHTPDSSWIDFLRERLRRMIMLELLKTGDMVLIGLARQSEFLYGDPQCCPLLRGWPQFQKPKGWECVDHMIPAWLEEWKTNIRDRADSFDLTPRPLSVSKKSSSRDAPPPRFDLSSVPPLPPRLRGTMTSKLPSKSIDAPLLTLQSDRSPSTSKSSTSSNRSLPRSTSVNGTFLPQSTTHKLSMERPLQSHTSSSQLRPPRFIHPLHRKQSVPSLSHHRQQQSSIPTLGMIHDNPMDSRSRTIKRTTSTQQLDHPTSSLAQRRSKASILPSLDVSPRNSQPLIPDLHTPPPDAPLPALPSGQQNTESAWQSRESSLSPRRKRLGGVYGGSGFTSSSPVWSQDAVPVDVEMNWI